MLPFYYYIFISLYFSIYCQISLCDSVFDEIHGSDSPEFLVVSGHRPDRGAEKYVVSLRYEEPAAFFGDNHICGGAIISTKAILTAAHCVVVRGREDVTMSPKKLTVVAGSLYRLKREASTRIFKVRKVVKHSEYEFLHQENDIAILYLKTAITTDGKTIAEIPMPARPMLPFMACIVLGWGRLFTNGPLPDHLLQTTVSTITLTECEDSYQDDFHDGMICAKDVEELERDACGGDSGGPLICGESLAGIVSFGMGCANLDFPGVYSDVYFYRDWISESQRKNLIAIPIQANPNLLCICLCITVMKKFC